MFARLSGAKRSATLAVCFSVVLLVAAGPAYGSSETRPRVVPPHSSVLDATYGQWSARWWEWALETPVHTGSAITHPLLSAGAVDCGIGQSDGVWFLGGGFNTPPNFVASRSCAIPDEKFLFFPIYNSWIDNSNCDGLAPTTFTVKQLRAMVDASVDGVSSLSVTIDGQVVDGIRTTSTPFRTQSPVFSYTTAADSLINFEFCPFHAQTVRGAVADGVYVMLAPLPEGTHTLHWSVHSGTTLVMDITYRLTVGND